MTDQEKLENAKETRVLVQNATDTAYLDVISHSIGNGFIEPYECADVINCFGVNPEILREYTLEIYNDEDTELYFANLWAELDLVCDLCEEETDMDHECQNTECEACGEDYKEEEEE